MLPGSYRVYVVAFAVRSFIWGSQRQECSASYRIIQKMVAIEILLKRTLFPGVNTCFFPFR